jgi:phosphopantothenoylcysteine decarboxylase / phosphopantothenate---cysteine ligase
MSRNKILFKLSGSIACFKAAALISKLVQAGFEVQTVATSSALKFVGEATLEGLTGKKVLSDTFERGDLMGHINWAKWADLVIVCPATANTINKLANGIGDDLVTTLFLAHDFKKPYLVAPAMNTRMIEHPATQDSLAKLRSFGVEILEPSAGTLACGDVGNGRLIEPEDALAQIQKSLAVASLDQKFAADESKAPQKRILITSGGTREPIDGVRSIANISTGETGAVIADHLADVGHDVTLLHASGSRLPKNAVNLKPYVTFADLDAALKGELASHYDAVIHLAAVSDYSIDSIELDGKKQKASTELKVSSQAAMKLNLKRNPKLIDSLREYSLNKDIKIVAFKLTTNANAEAIQEKVEALLKASTSNLLVHNDSAAISKAMHKATIYGSTAIPLTQTKTKLELAENLEQFIREGQL